MASLLNDDITWFTLPFVDEPLNSVIHLGNGKDADLIFEFASGRRLRLGASRARVETDRGITVEVYAHGDTLLNIAYTGADLSLRHGRIGILEDDERWRARFLEDASAWVKSDVGELLYAVNVELRLAVASQPAPVSS